MAKRKKPGKQFVSTAQGGIGRKPASLLKDIRGLIRAARAGVAQTVNSALVLLYWQIGRRIHMEILQKRRAEYGQEILSTLSKELTAYTFGS